MRTNIARRAASLGAALLMLCATPGSLVAYAEETASAQQPAAVETATPETAASGDTDSADTTAKTNASTKKLLRATVRQQNSILLASSGTGSSTTGSFTYADTEQGVTFTYTVADGKATITGVTNPEEEKSIAIPSKITAGGGY